MSINRKTTWTHTENMISISWKGWRYSKITITNQSEIQFICSTARPQARQTSWVVTSLHRCTLLIDECTDKSHTPTTDKKMSIWSILSPHAGSGLADHWTAELPRDQSATNSRLSLSLLVEEWHATDNATWYWTSWKRVRVYFYLLSFISKKRLYSERSDTQINSICSDEGRKFRTAWVSVKPLDRVGVRQFFFVISSPPWL